MVQKSKATPQSPERDASPSNVHSWFFTILKDLHSVHENEVREIASKWKYRRNSELSYYDVNIFRLVFKSEAGTLLFGHARRELRIAKGSPSTGVGQVEKAKVERPKSNIFRLTPGCECQDFLSMLMYGVDVKLTTILATPLYLLFLLSIAAAYAAYVSKGDKAAGMGVISVTFLVLFVLMIKSRILYEVDGLGYRRNRKLSGISVTEQRNKRKKQTHFYQDSSKARGCGTCKV